MAYLGVVSSLEGFCVCSIPGALGQSNELVQALVDDCQISPELPLPWHHSVQERHLPAPSQHRLKKAAN